MYLEVCRRERESESPVENVFYIMNIKFFRTEPIGRRGGLIESVVVDSDSARTCVPT
jgi:hypothetical protein